MFVLKFNRSKASLKSEINFITCLVGAKKASGCLGRSYLYLVWSRRIPCMVAGLHCLSGPTRSDERGRIAHTSELACRSILSAVNCHLLITWVSKFALGDTCSALLIRALQSQVDINTRTRLIQNFRFCPFANFFNRNFIDALL